MPEIYVSTDIETDGPIPGPHAMLSFASVYRADKTLLRTFATNLHLAPRAGKAASGSQNFPAILVLRQRTCIITPVHPTEHARKFCLHCQE